MNWSAVFTIYRSEMIRFFRTFVQSFISPVISTSLYFVVFGTAIGSRIQEVEGVSYAAFIVPGLIMLSVMTQSISMRASGYFSPSLQARYMSCFQHRSIFWKLCWAMLAQRPPKRSLSGL